MGKEEVQYASSRECYGLGTNKKNGSYMRWRVMCNCWWNTECWHCAGPSRCEIKV